jgi:hypothetical protein
MKTKEPKAKCGGKNNGCYFETIVIDYVAPIEGKYKQRIVYQICLN